MPEDRKKIEQKYRERTLQQRDALISGNIERQTEDLRPGDITPQDNILDVENREDILERLSIGADGSLTIPIRIGFVGLYKIQFPVDGLAFDDTDKGKSLKIKEVQGNTVILEWKA